MRSVLYRFPDLERFERVLFNGGRDSGLDAELELGLPAGESAEDGEWVLAVFELGTGRRATSAAARAVVSPEGARLTFEPRDWTRLSDFARAEAARRASATALTRPSQAPHGKGARILIVDDDPDIRDVVLAMLEAVELSVTSATSAEEALARVRSEPFDLLVLDWNLPRMSGIELCRALRQEPGVSDIPVLFLTANASSQDMVEAFASGADDFVVKPFRAPELGARIFSLLRRVRRSSSA